MSKVLILNYSHPCDDISKYQVIPKDSICTFDWNEEDQEWQYQEKGGQFEGVRLWNGQQWENFIDHESECDIFNIFESEMIIEKVDYKTGKDLITFTDEDGEEQKGLYSRWNGETGYIYSLDATITE